MLWESRYSSDYIRALGVLTSFEQKSKLLKGSHIGDYVRTTIGVTEGDTRSLDYSSFEFIP